MSRRAFGLALALALAPALLLAAAASAQKGGAMMASAPEKMTPPGESAAMRDCDRMAMDQHIKMEDRARFVQGCVAAKMKAAK